METVNMQKTSMASSLEALEDGNDYNNYPGFRSWTIAIYWRNKGVLNCTISFRAIKGR